MKLAETINTPQVYALTQKQKDVAQHYDQLHGLTRHFFETLWPEDVILTDLEPGTGLDEFHANLTHAALQPGLSLTVLVLLSQDEEPHSYRVALHKGGALLETLEFSWKGYPQEGRNARAINDMLLRAGGRIRKDEP